MIKLTQNINIMALCAFMYTPIYLYNKQISVVLVFVSFVIWFITSINIDNLWLNRFKPYAITLMSMILLNIVYCITTGTDMYSTLVTSLLAYTGVLFFAFYSHHTNLLKWPFVFLLILLSVDCIDTIKGNLLFPGISRKQALNYDVHEAAVMQMSMHIGSYPFLYSLSLISLPITLFFKNKLISKYLYILLILLFLTTILYGSYFISFILMILMFFLGIMNIKSLKKAISSLVLIVGLFLIIQNPILDSIVYLGEKTNSRVLVQHAMEIKHGRSSDDADMVTGGRTTLYINAIQNFIEHPLVGQMDGEKSRHFSMHSELLEYLEKYGLLSFPFFYIWFLLFKRQRILLRTKRIRTYHTIFFLTLMFFLLINPIRNEQPFTLMVYCIIPLMFMFLDSKLYNQRLNE